MIKAILIDDDITTLDGLFHSVPWEKFNVEICGTAVNGVEGIELIEQHEPQLILTDIYMPVMDGIEMLRRVRAAGNEAQVIILSGYEDFKYAQSALKLQVADYLSKPATLMEIEEVLKTVTDRIVANKQEKQEEQELKELLELHRPNTKKLLMKGLLESNFTRTPFFEKASKQLQISFAQQCFTVVLMEYAVPRNRPNVKRSDHVIYTYAISNIIEEMSQTNKEVVLADIQQNVIALIVTLPDYLREETIRQRVKYVIGSYVENIKTYLKLEVWVAIGKVVYSVHDIAGAFTSTLDLLAKRDYANSSLIIDEAEMSKNISSAEFPRLFDHYQALIRSVMDGQEDVARQHIEQIRHTLEQYETLSVTLLRSSVVEMIGMLSNSLYDAGILFEDLHLQKNWYQEIETIHHADDFLHFLSELSLEACRSVAGRGNHKHNKTVDFMKRYVQEHYSEDVTLDDIADKVFLTRNYLSQIFKQVTGENYNSYMTRIRMEKAKEMIISGQYKLYEIAQMVGYKNYAYFSQQFKRFYGKTPSEY